MATPVKVSLALDKKMIEAVDGLGDAERRSRSNMIAVLLEEALAAREAAKANAQEVAA